MIDLKPYENIVASCKGRAGWNEMAELIEEQLKIIRAAEQKIEDIIGDFDND